MLTRRGQQHSFSTHERMFLWMCRSFWEGNVSIWGGLEPPTSGCMPNALTIWAIRRLMLSAGVGLYLVSLCPFHKRRKAKPTSWFGFSYNAVQVRTWMSNNTPHKTLLIHDSISVKRGPGHFIGPFYVYDWLSISDINIPSLSRSHWSWILWFLPGSPFDSVITWSYNMTIILSLTKVILHSVIHGDRSTDRKSRWICQK